MSPEGHQNETDDEWIGKGIDLHRSLLVLVTVYNDLTLVMLRIPDIHRIYSSSKYNLVHRFRKE